MTWDRDLIARRLSQAREGFGLNRCWLHELGDVYGRGPMPEGEFWARYAAGRSSVAKLWTARPRITEADEMSFYAETDYWVLRQMFYHRHSSFHWILRHLRTRGSDGEFCEYGSGVAPITNWLHPRLRSWLFTVADVACPAFDFARDRFRARGRVGRVFVRPGALPELTRRYDGIAVLEVLEHVRSPLRVVEYLVSRLRPGGHLFINFSNDPPDDENLESSQRERPAVLAFLDSALTPVRPLDDPGQTRGHYRCPA